MRPLDPTRDFIVVRRADDGRHDHVVLKDLDRLFESIGEVRSGVIPADIERRISDLEEVAKAMAQALETVSAKVNTIIDLADSLVKGRQ